ncbi:hypothetical protein [Caulobacter sp. 602-2]|nr:hypothetical protein [Caulobacter sp. 602-2]
MREPAFRSFLSGRLAAGSVDSYVAYCNRVRRELGVDLDADDLSEPALLSLSLRLAQSGAPPATVRNCLSALRAYAEFRLGAAAGPGSAMRITAEQRAAWKANTATGPFNLWLDGQVRDERGAFDLARLHDLAERYGVHKRDEYSGLNPGQQRMNLGNLLRRVVPASAYEAAPEPPAAPAVAPGPQGTALGTASVGELLALYGQIMDELRERGVVRTGNSPVGDYGELLFARAFGWTLEGNSSAGHDATDADGVRYQIKARRLASPSASRQLSAIRRLEERTFDHLAAVLLDGSFKVLRAIIIPYAVVQSGARRRDHTNSWLFMLEDRVWKIPGVRDVTAELAVAQAAI